MKFKGKVIWFDNQNGYGFIQYINESNEQKDIFVHFSDIEMDGFKSLINEQIVHFNIGQNYSGKPKAIDVVAQ